MSDRVVFEPAFDPWTCQWCAETGFDLRGLAHHVWTKCEVVERLAEENMENVRAWHHRNYEEAQRRRRDSNSDPKGEKPSGFECGASQSGLSESEGIAQTSPKDSTS